VTLRVGEVGGRLGGVEINEQLRRREDRHWVLAGRAGVATLALAAMFIVAAVAIGRRLVGKPTEALMKMARDISAGKLDTRVHLKQRHELAELGEEMNAMADALAEANRKLESESRARLAALEELRHAERLSTVGKLAAGVAHELGTPITVIDGHAREIGLSEGDLPRARNSVRVIREQVRNMTRIIRQLLGFARRTVPARRDEPLKPIADRTLEVLFPLAAKKGVHLAGHVPEALQAHIDASGVQQVLTNLVLNGIQATPEGGEVEVTAGVVQREAPGGEPSGHRSWIRLDVLDTGIGLTEEVKPHLFEPFFTTKGVGEGTGLGLSVAEGLIRENGGWIAVESAAGSGACFSIYLPPLQETRDGR
jgi:signal transduction histidine kinase